MTKSKLLAPARTLLEDVEDFLLLFPEVKPAMVGKMAVSDKDLVSDLRQGRSPRENTAAKVRAWMAKYAAERESGAARVQQAARRLRRSLPPVGAASDG